MDVDAEYDTGPGPLQTCPDCGASLHHSRKERVSVNERIKRAMLVLHQSRLSLVTALIAVLDPSQQDFTIFRSKVYKSGKLHRLLDTIFEDTRGSSSLLAWMEPRAIETVSQKVYNEMDNIKEDIQLKIDSITPEFLALWDVGSTIGTAMANHAPTSTLSKLLPSACQTTRTCKENTVKDSKIVCIGIITSSCVKVSCRSHVRSLSHSSQKFDQIVAYIFLHHSHSSCGRMAHQGRRSKPLRDAGSASRSHP